MIIYLLKMIACSAAFYALYALLFQKEKMLVFNRFYLLGSLAISFFIPLITFEVEAPATVLYQYTEAYLPVEYVTTETTERSLSYYMPYAAYIIAPVISFILLIRFIKNIIQLRRCMARHKRVCISGTKISLLDQPVVPHSFLNAIFLNKTEYEQGGIEAEVLAHELAHVKQKHSYDILFIELMQVFCWFNPMIYLYKRSIKVNHELLADAAVVKKFDNVHNYQHILLQRSGINTALLMASSFNFLITKKRLIMLQKTFNKKRTTWFALTVLPLIIALTFSFCNTVEKQKDTDDTKIVADTETQEAQQSTALQDSAANVVDSNDVPPPPKIVMKQFTPPKIIHELPEGPGATPKELAQYEAIINEVKVDGNGYRQIEGKTDKLYPIYKKMTYEQRGKASQLPPPPPPAINKSGVKTLRVTVSDDQSKKATIIFNNGSVVNADVSTPEKAKAFEEKYGVELPPPPPVPPKKERKSFTPPKIIKDEKTYNLKLNAADVSELKGVVINNKRDILYNGKNVKKLIIDGKEFYPSNFSETSGDQIFKSIKVVNDKE